jgi:uncharacterized protein
MSDRLKANCLVDRPAQPVARLLFAHGAGAPMDSDFMAHMAQGLCQQQVEVIRFEFPYMAERRRTGKRRPPNPFAQIVAAYEAQVAAWSGSDVPLFVAGKSMGGRAAASLSMAEISGAVVYGYPLHPVGKPESLRLAPLQARQLPLLIVQGTRDKLGDRASFSQQTIDGAVQWCWLEDGDHDLKPRKASGHTHDEHLARAVAATVQFIHAQQALAKPRSAAH